MKKLRPDLLMFLAAFFFMVTALLSERPAVYIGLFAVFLVLAIGMRRKHREGTGEQRSGS